MAHHRSLSENPRRSYRIAESVSSGRIAHESHSALIPMVRNCSSCLDLYHRMLNISSPLTREDRSGDRITVGENRESTTALRGPVMGDADDFEFPMGSEQTPEQLSPTRGTGSCVFLFRKDTSEWQLSRDWHDLFETTVEPANRDDSSRADPSGTEPSRTERSGLSVPPQGIAQVPRTFENRVQSGAERGNNNNANGPQVIPGLPAVRFDKATSTTAQETGKGQGRSRN